MDPAHARASAVPAEAIFDPETDCWELSERDELGRRHGACRRFRADGTLFEVAQYQAGVRDGPFCVYHPNGDIARQGAFTHGTLHGSLSAFASDVATTEALRACCVPTGAWELRALYARGQSLREHFFDRAGRALLSNGDLQPDRPDTVAARATLDETDQRWIEGELDADGRRVGTFRAWMLDGTLAEECAYRDGAPTRALIYDAAGAVVEDVELAGDSEDERVRHGAFFRRFSAADNPYADARVRAERGRFDRGRPVGRWTLLDDGGATLIVIELGLALDEDRVGDSPAFAIRAPAAPTPGTRDDRGWGAVATHLAGEGRVREALCAAARATAATGDTAMLVDLLSRSALPLSSASRAERAAQLSESSIETLTSALDALVDGVDAAIVFRTLASVLDSEHAASLDFIEASLRLEPHDRKSVLTRALIRIEHGDDRGAMEDLEVLARESPDEARALGAHMRPHFPELTFWPAREALPLAPTPSASDDDDAAAATAAQPLPAVRNAIQIYATRLSQLRHAVQQRIGARVPEPRWLPPDLSALLPDGPVTLRRFATLVASPIGAVADAGDAAGPSEIQIDETLPPGLLENGSVASLLATARATWSALAWLCWACGLDRVALPADIAPPAAFAAAVAMSVARCFRAHDRMLTGGVRGAAQGLPGFTWEGIDIDQLPYHFARMASAEYLEIRSMFLWLCLPDAQSPFQSDLREA